MGGRQTDDILKGLREPTWQGCDKCKQLQAALSEMLHSFNKHWIKMTLKTCKGITPTEIALSVVHAEEALKDGE